MNTFNALAKASTETLLAPADRITTASGTGVDISQYEGLALVILNSAAGTGTTPTLAVVLEECDTSGGTYTAVPSGAYTGVTDAAASQQKIVLDVGPRKKFLRATATIGGTSPHFLTSCAFVGMKKYA
jgi:hypothetical protein